AGSGREQYPPAALRLPHAAGAGATPSVARLRKLHPDLLLMPNGTSARAAASLQKGVGVPVYVAGPGTLPGIEHDVDQVGTLAGLRHSKATRDLPAVRHRRFSLVDDGALTDTGPRVVTEVRDLARLLHPSLQIP